MTRSWVDRDMFMRYIGGGVGHIAHESALPADDRDLDVDVEAETSEPRHGPMADNTDVESGEKDDGLQPDSDSDSDSDAPGDSDDSSLDGEGSDGAYDDEDDIDDAGFAEL
ncbi:hypothetical protein C8R45DRAFT_939670 [Mycena sanguinolenta]|nr:hypothetical protein C8R45DRAFT_939670 [Mycena sanguinolenta]